MKPPLILVTNDDGVDSLGLWAAVEAVAPLGDVLVVAPDRQWSGAGRSMPRKVTGAWAESVRKTQSGQKVRAIGIDASPALCVVHAMTEFAPRTPSLLVSGINFGENVSSEITISGTVGAALEAATFHVPALSVSLEMSIPDHLTGGDSKDYTASQYFTALFARLLLERAPPYDVDVLNVNVPNLPAAQIGPPRLTRLGRRGYTNHFERRVDPWGQSYFWLSGEPEERDAGEGTDIGTIAAGRLSITPLHTDLTDHALLDSLQGRLAGLLDDWSD